MWRRMKGKRRNEFKRVKKLDRPRRKREEKIFREKRIGMDAMKQGKREDWH